MCRPPRCAPWPTISASPPTTCWAGGMARLRRRKPDAPADGAVREETIGPGAGPRGGGGPPPRVCFQAPPRRPGRLAYVPLRNCSSPTASWALSTPRISVSSSFCLRSKHTTSWSAAVAWMETGRDTAVCASRCPPATAARRPAPGRGPPGRGAPLPGAGPPPGHRGARATRPGFPGSGSRSFVWPSGITSLSNPFYVGG